MPLNEYPSNLKLGIKISLICLLSSSVRYPLSNVSIYQLQVFQRTASLSQSQKTLVKHPLVAYLRLDFDSRLDAYSFISPKLF
jgi:hypothetical protein